MLRHYRVTNLGDLSIVTPDRLLARTGHKPGASIAGTVLPDSHTVWRPRAFRRPVPEAASHLWYNADLFTNEAGNSYAEESVKFGSQPGVNKSTKHGIAALVAHEIGHLIGNASRHLAAWKNMAREELSRVVIRDVRTPEAAAAERRVAAEYTAQVAFFRDAPNHEVENRHRKELKEAGFTGDLNSIPPVAEIRTERISALNDKYYGPTPTNELSKAIVVAHSGEYAGTSLYEQEADSAMAAVVNQQQADEVGRTTFGYIMEPFGRSANDVPRDYLKFHTTIDNFNRAEATRIEYKGQWGPGYTPPKNPWLDHTPSQQAKGPWKTPAQHVDQDAKPLPSRPQLAPAQVQAPSQGQTPAQGQAPSQGQAHSPAQAPSRAEVPSQAQAPSPVHRPGPVSQARQEPSSAQAPSPVPQHGAASAQVAARGVTPVHQVHSAPRSSESRTPTGAAGRGHAAETTPGVTVRGEARGSRQGRELTGPADGMSG